MFHIALSKKIICLFSIVLMLMQPLQVADAYATDNVPAVVQIYSVTYDTAGNLSNVWTGTGFFISWDGAILTNNHVIDGADEVFICVAEDERSTPSCDYTATILATDPNLDIALLYPAYTMAGDYVLESFETDSYIAISPFLPELSEEVYVLGYPYADLSSSITVTDGIVSSFSGDYFVTDATINPGNSGGPVFSVYDDKVLGVATAISTEGEGGNYGYAITNEAIFDWLYDLVDSGLINQDFVDEMSAVPVFDDLTVDDNNYIAISNLYDMGIISGYPDGTFRPDNELNRAELLKILVESYYGTPDEYTYRNCFTDVGTEWYAKYVCYSKAQGWINGYSDGTFRPANSVNKVEALKMILEVFEQEIIPASGAIFQDVSSGQWYSDYVNTAKELGLLEEIGNYYPSSNISRGGVSENIYRLVVLTLNSNGAVDSEGGATLKVELSDYSIDDYTYFEQGDVGEVAQFDLTAEGGDVLVSEVNLELIAGDENAMSYFLIYEYVGGNAVPVSEIDTSINSSYMVQLPMLDDEYIIPEGDTVTFAVWTSFSPDANLETLYQFALDSSMIESDADYLDVSYMETGIFGFVEP